MEHDGRPAGPTLLRDRYEPLERIGSGGQGEVLRALDHQHERLVALKIRPVGGPEEKKALLSEARVLLGLRPHDALPLVRDDFFTDDRYVIVMDWVDGTDLRRLLDEQGDPGLPVGSVLGYMADIAAALDHLHSHDPPIVHGDVKPANCVVTKDGRVVLVDFGIATRTGVLGAGSGTRGFIAPEVAAGHPATPAADIFGLAATTFALLTGHAPEREWPEFEGIAAATARALGRAIRLGLATDPTRRPRLATELIERLRSWQEATLPTGTVTFLFTDIEGSTPQWEAHPEEMPHVIARQEQLIADAVESHGGRFVKSRGEGDSTLSVFTRASDAISAAIAMQRALSTEPWPPRIEVRVRAGVHTGEAQLREGDYYGQAVNRAARVRSLAVGGQTLISQAAEQLIRDSLPTNATLVDVGARELKGLARAERVFELRHPDLPHRERGSSELEDVEAGAPELPNGDTPRVSTRPPTNLPTPLDAFIGRAAEVADVEDALRTRRLVTLTGPGGTGKTRLAIEVARRIGSRFPDGVWFVDLAALGDPALVPQAFVTALAVDIAPDVGSLSEHLRTKQTLLIVDNSEHLLDATARVVEQILRDCPNVAVLATSREPLGITGEMRWDVPPLSTPLPRDGLTMERLGTCEAVQLFCDRAKLNDRRFAPDDDDARPIAEICYRLDGIPLAIELAAARVATMSVGDIAARLDDAFSLLVSGSRTALPRQRTLHALIRWSYDLLDDQERTLLRRASVFLSSFSVDGVEAISGSLERAGDLLASLVDKSLVVTLHDDGTTRYRFLDTIRRFANDLLMEAAEIDEVQELLKQWCLSVVERSYDSSERVRYVSDISKEYPTIRGVLSSSIDAGNARDTQRLAGGLGTYWIHSATPYEGFGWLRKALALSSEPTAVRARCLTMAARMAVWFAPIDEVVAYAEEAVAIQRGLDDVHSLVEALHTLGVVLANTYVGRVDEAREHLEECVRLATEDESCRDLLLNVVGDLAAFADTPGERERLWRQHLDLARRNGDVAATTRALLELANIAWTHGRLDQARELYEEQRALTEKHGHTHMLALTCSYEAHLLMEMGELDQAQVLLDKAVELSRAIEDRFRRATLVWTLGISMGTLDPTRARGLNEESLSLCREIDAANGIAANLETLGHHAMRLGEYDLAQRHFEEALRIEQEISGFADQMALLTTLGHLASLRGDCVAANNRHRESLQLAVEHKFGNYVALAAEGMAMAAGAEGRHRDAARLFGVMTARNEELGLPRRRNAPVFIENMSPVDWSASSEFAEAAARAELGPEAFESAYTEGLRTTTDDLLSILTSD